MKSPFTGRVTRGEYLRVGLSLMALKYVVDAIVYSLVVGGLWHPLDYLNPIYAQRMAGSPEALDLPPWYPVFLLLWGLAFAWIGTAWSARRSMDAGLSPWWGLFFFVPFLNYALIVVLVALPTSDREVNVPSASARERRVSMLVLGAVLFLAMSSMLYLVIVQWSGNYGVEAFVSLPFFFGAGLGYLLNRPVQVSVGQTLMFALVSSSVACAGLLLFALEGVICILMAFPVVFAAIFIGALVGRMMAGLSTTKGPAPLCLLLALPLSTWVEQNVEATPAREVASAIEIDAPIEVVWEHVVAFSELPEPEGWLFDTGIAYPMRARIEGRGVGAVRYCEFSTGAFVEPITVWDEPHRLGFDVIEQPVPMEEWSFYDDVKPPHLTTTFRSVRGEFRLTELPGGRTLLEGSTWYELDMAPEVYWRLWADEIIHRIHGRVLRHVKALSEEESEG
jgi:uncharacterized membrane protein YhaH (DUF805 family)